MTSVPDGCHILIGPPIHDLEVVPLRRIPDERGTIMHMLRSTDPHFRQFGEIYFTTIHRGVIKGWHTHRDLCLNYACLSGMVKFVVYDGRDDSPTKGSLTEIFAGADNHLLVVIPPGLTNGMKGMTDPSALVANCATHVHEPGRTTRDDPFGDSVPYDWGVRNH
jgi:dTDP-4-dehydrorhamnose 3,5-epimerase